MIDKATVRLLKLIAINAHAAYNSCLVGNPAPRVEAMYQRMITPEPGDLVLETSTIWRWARDSDAVACDQLPGLGILKRRALEPIMDRAAFDDMHAHGDYWVRPDETLDDLPKETVYYIEPLDGTVPEYRWVNANFIRVSSSLDDADGRS